MSYHSGTIHAVRFSPGGKFLASGADDKIVCIYTLDPSPPSHAAFGLSETCRCEEHCAEILSRFERGTSGRELAHLSKANWP